MRVKKRPIDGVNFNRKRYEILGPAELHREFQMLYSRLTKRLNGNHRPGNLATFYEADTEHFGVFCFEYGTSICFALKKAALEKAEKEKICRR